MADMEPVLAGRIAVLLLAAGRSTRFGSRKLEAQLAGKPLIHYAAHTLADIPFAYRLCVSAQGDIDLAAFGFEAVDVHADLPMSASIAAGMAAVAPRDVDAVMIALGDMPLVGAGHIARLIAGFDGSLIASSNKGVATPPAIFGRVHFPYLAELSGDGGARALLRSAPVVEANPSELLDVDTPDDLIAALKALESAA